MSIWPLNGTKLAVACVCGLATGLALVQTLPLARAHPVFLLALPISLAFLLLSALRVEWVVAAVLMTRALLDPLLQGTRVSFAGDAIGLGALINLMVLFLAVFLFVRERGWGALRRHSSFPFWAAYLAVCLASIAYSPVPEKAVRQFFALSSYACMMAIPLLLVRGQGDKRFWIKLLFFSSILPVLLADLDLARGGQEFAFAGARIMGSFSHPNILAFYLVLQVALVLYILKGGFFRLRLPHKALLWAYAVNLVVLLAATKTRNAWFAAWLLFALYGLARDRSVLLVSLLLPPLAFLNPGIRERVVDLFQNTGGALEGELNSLAWRLELWKRAGGSIGESPWFGHGLGSFKPLSAGFFPEGAPAHNDYLEVLFETGILGLAAFLLLFASLAGSCLRAAARLPRRLRAEQLIFAAYVACYMLSSAGDNMQDYLAFNWYFWFLAGVNARSASLAHENIGHHPVL